MCVSGLFARYTLQEFLIERGEADIARAKAALAKHVGRLFLTPTIRDGRPVYTVTGSMAADTDGEVST
jgi:hypothetical protein